MHVYRNIQELYLTQFSRGTSLYIYIYIYKVVVISARKLPKYSQLPNKYPRDISMYIYTFLRHLKIFVYSTVSPGTPNVGLGKPKVPRNPV
jgi:hypothetical protein